MRKILHIFLSLVIVFSTTVSAFAASPAGWVAQNTVMNGATATITAIKGGGATAMKAVVQHAPAAASVAKNIVGLGSAVAVAYAVNELVGAGVDWVLDPANNTVKYKDSAPASPEIEYYFTSGVGFSGASRNIETLARSYYAHTCSAGYSGYCNPKSFSCDSVKCTIVGGDNATRSFQPSTRPVEVPAEYKTIPYANVASKIISNAAAGHSPSQDFLKSAAVADVESGLVDSALNSAAVPDADASNPPTTDPNDPSVPFDPSSIIAALKSVMSAIDNMASGLKKKMETMLVEIGLMKDEVIAEEKITQQVINDGMADVVAANQATEARVGDVVAAIEALEGNTLDGKVINDAVDRAIAAGHTDTASIVAAIESIEGNTLDGQVINDAVDKVIANDDANAKAANDVVSDSVDKAIEAGQADATKVADAVDAQTDAITTTDPTTGEKSLSLPSFCSWAGPVCTFIDWSKNQWLEFTLTFTALKDWLFEDAPPNDKDNTLDTPVLPVTPVQVAINFVGSCPAPLTFEYKIYNQTFKPSVPFTPMCEVAVMINPVIKICASIAAIFIVAGIRQGNS